MRNFLHLKELDEMYMGIPKTKIWQNNRFWGILIPAVHVLYPIVQLGPAWLPRYNEDPAITNFFFGTMVLIRYSGVPL